MQIAVFGLGYVGTVCATCFADLGHTVVGVDVSREKVDLLNSGRSPIIEPQVADLAQRAVAERRLRATLDPQDAIHEADLSFICVGTPSLPGGGQDRQYIRRVAEDIGRSLAGRTRYCGIVIRSTVIPGTVEEVVAPAVRKFAKGAPFGVASNPEFLREGTAVDDFLHPPYTLIGASDPRLVEMLRTLYAAIDAPIEVADVRVAEMLKFVNNSFHALKVVFANEVGTVCKALDVDSHTLMELFVRDRKLNISEKYLRPGFAFGGSCLPKDVRALDQLARSRDLELPVVGAIMRSNELHVRRAVRMVEEAEGSPVGVLGIAFKPGTDDLRESPVVELAETLIGRGYDVRIYDPSVNLALLTGSNKRFMEEQIPHLAKLLTESAEELVAQCNTVVLGYDDPRFVQALDGRAPGCRIIDLAGVSAGAFSGSYSGIAW